MAVVVAIIVAGVLLLLASRRGATREAIDLRLTPHAVERMAERGVGETAVRTALARPDRVIATSYVDKRRGVRPGEQDQLESVRLEKDFRGRTLKVWVPPEWRTQTPIAVKSVAWNFVATVRVPRARIGAIIGRGGQNVRNLEDIYDLDIHVDSARSTVRISGDDNDAVTLARRRIVELAR
jgi:hypothetical protein